RGALGVRAAAAGPGAPELPGARPLAAPAGPGAGGHGAGGRASMPRRRGGTRGTRGAGRRPGPRPGAVAAARPPPRGPPPAGSGREGPAWLAAAAFVVRARTSRLPGVPTGALVLLLGGLSVLAFRERLLPFTDGGALLAEAAQVGQDARRQDPRLASGLQRASLAREMEELQTNTGLAAGLSTLDGYHLPTRRFLELVFSLKRVPDQPPT